jgi:hypothetical protein
LVNFFNTFYFLGTNTLWPCHEDEEDAANSDSKTINSDLDDDDGPDTDIEGIDEFPDIDFDENEIKGQSTDEDKVFIKGGDSFQSSLWINPSERDIEDLKKLVAKHCDVNLV